MVLRSENIPFILKRTVLLTKAFPVLSYNVTEYCVAFLKYFVRSLPLILDRTVILLVIVSLVVGLYDIIV